MFELIDRAELLRYPHFFYQHQSSVSTIWKMAGEVGGDYGYTGREPSQPRSKEGGDDNGGSGPFR